MPQVNGTPKIGDTINIRHRTVRGGRDGSKVECEFSSDTVKRKVTAVYVGTNTVRDQVGESWVVCKAEDGTAWDTVY